MRKHVRNQQTTWHVINIKARHNQSTKHYVDIFEKLMKEDPLVKFNSKRAASLKSVQKSDEVGPDGNPLWIEISLLAYTIINPDEFYDLKNKKDVKMDNWNEDVVANKVEADMLFIPSLQVHKIALRKNSKITLNRVVEYFQKALQIVEPDTFDVDVIINHDTIQRVINADSILSFEADVSFSNPGSTSGFRHAFEDKMKTSRAGRVQMKMNGSKDCPLVADKDGIIQTVAEMSEENGNFTASVIERGEKKVTKIASKDYPRIVTIPQIIDNIASTVYNYIRTAFSK